MIGNKARLVCKGYTQVECICFKEAFAPVTRLEVVQIFLTLAVYNNFKVYDMDVKLVFLNGKLEEEDYIE